MDRRTTDTVRVAATVVGVSTGLLALASTAQTRDGYIHASFGGPLDVFSSNTADVLSIGDGANDATELATLLKGPVGPAAKDGAADSPFRVAYEAGVAPNATTGAATVMPSADPTAPSPDGKDPVILPSKPVVDAQGRIDCAGAVSCKTDPATNVTTVTYPDGVVAVVQKINGLTVVAYKTIIGALPSEIATLLPPPPVAPPVLAAVAPTATSAPSTAPEVPSSVLQTTAPSSPSSPVREPALHPAEPTPPSIATPKETGHSSSTAPAPNLPSKVKDALGGIADTVKDAVGSVGKALSPGASTNPEDSGPSSNGPSSNGPSPNGPSANSGHSSNSGQSGNGKSGAGEKSDQDKASRPGSDEG